MSVETTEIRDGIEWYRWRLPDGTCEEGCQCARCGSSAYHVDCWDCGGEGWHFGADIAGYYDFGWIDEDAAYECNTCGGKGGHWHCCSGREWCEAHPMAGREDVRSTAYPNGERGDE